MGITPLAASQSSELGVGAFIISFLISLFILIYAKQAGYFRLPFPVKSKPISFGYILGAYLIYLSASFFLVPVIYLLIAYISTGSIKGIKLSPLLLGYLQFFSVLLMAGCIIGYCCLIPSSIRRAIFWGNNPVKLRVFFRSFGMGVLTWLICYPLMYFVNLIAGLLSTLLWGEKGVVQVAVQNLSDTRQFPLVFSLMIFAIVILVPLVEEILFRGFLQSWLRELVGRKSAIFLVAIFFALVHFAPSQGRGNLELILSLFVLSCFLGFIYERERTLFAPLALHMTFNGISVIVLATS